MYIYPDNLKQKATMWLWKLNDLVILSVMLLGSFALLVKLFLIPPIVITIVYAFLTIQFEGSSIKDFLQHALRYFVLKPQEYVWEVEAHAPERKDRKKKTLPRAGKYPKAH